MEVEVVLCLPLQPGFKPVLNFRLIFEILVFLFPVPRHDCFDISNLELSFLLDRLSFVFFLPISNHRE